MYTRGPEPTVIPEAVNSLTKIYSNELFSCRSDTDGFKCWKFNATIAMKPSFNSVTKDSITLSSQISCGVVTVTGELFCLVPQWSQTRHGFLRIKPVKSITAVAVSNVAICWGDGDANESKIACQIDGGAFWSSFPGATLKTLKDLIVRWSPSGDAVCRLAADFKISCADPLTGELLPVCIAGAEPARFGT